MHQGTFVWKLSCWLQDAGTKLQRTLARSPLLRLALLGGLGLCGQLVLLSPFIALIGGVSTALYLGDNIRGPLDWFLIEVCAALSLVAALACYQLLRMRPAAARGIPLSKHQAPLLFSMLERRMTHFRIRQHLDVRLTGDAKLEIVTLPKSLLPLRNSYTLNVSAPLLFFVSEAQFRLALAGAIAASARRRSSLDGRIRQMAEDWPVVIGLLQEHRCLTSRLLLPALQLVAAGSARLTQDTDTTALQEQTRWVLDNTDEETTRELLTRQVLAGAFLAWQHWPSILKAAEHCPEPVVRPFSHFALFLNKSFTDEAARRWLLKAQAGADNTQSGLPDLLAELRLDCLCASTLPEHNALDSVFSDAKMLHELDKYWRQDIAPDWQRRHNEFQREKKRFEQLKKRADQHSLRGDSAINFIQLADRFLEPSEAIAMFRNVYRSNMDDPTVCFASGQAMLEAGHSLEGCDAMQRASELDGRLANRAHALINQHRQSWHGRKPRNLQLARIA